MIIVYKYWAGYMSWKPCPQVRTIDNFLHSILQYSLPLKILYNNTTLVRR